MRSFTIAALVGIASCLPSYTNDAESLEVSIVPDYVRPYVVRAYSLPGVVVGQQIYRFPVTGPSSDNAFTLISTAAPASNELGVLPHVSLWQQHKLLRDQAKLMPITDAPKALRKLLLLARQLQPLGVQRRQ